MERLLNVKEAAEFLNVSEMTVRRWTNAGLLHCYRIGLKRERRFSPQDLQEYLSRGTGSGTCKETVPLGFGGFSVPDGSHLTHLYGDVQEALAVQVSYLRQGIENGETVLVVATKDTREIILRTLEEHGLDIATLRNRGKMHLSQGMGNPTDMSRYVAQVVSSAQGRFRLLGDMSWTKRKGWSEEQVRNLEEMTNSSLSVGHLFLCQYSLGEFSGQQTMMAVETHKYAIYKKKLKESLLFFDEDSGAGKTQRQR